MAEPLAVVKPVTDFEVRRFQLPDLDRHARWFMPRLLAQFTHLNERQAIGFLRSVIYDNEYLFLYQEDAVALAQAMGSHALDATSIVWERFVWVREPGNQEQLKRAAGFYREMNVWAKRKGVATMYVEENTDVPHDLIKDVLGRVMTIEQKYVNVKEK